MSHAMHQGYTYVGRTVLVALHDDECRVSRYRYESTSTVNALLSGSAATSSAHRTQHPEVGIEDAIVIVASPPT